jgi:hypothetical protein
MTEDGKLRFRENQIISFLVELAFENGFSLSKIAAMDFSDEDRMQLAQLIGYSVAGYGMLSYTSDESYARALEMAKAVTESNK